MKYTRLFNSHSEYVAYTASTGFIRPNVSYCILEDEPHCTPPDFCEEGHTYEVIGTPSYPQTVAASATSFELSFNYNDIYTTITCQQMTTSSSGSVTIAIDENKTTSARTVSGVYNFHGIEIQYSITQQGKEETPYAEQYLTFDVLTSGDILWTHSGLTTPITISYSKDYGVTWQTITTTTGGTPISVNAGDKVYIKGTNTRYTEGDKTKFAAFSGGTATYNVEGNIMSLIYGDNFSGQTTLSTNWALANVFNTSNIISAENLVMPATTLSNYCYRATFANCSYLETPPELPATTLSEGCYWYMFDNDITLTVAPDLPSTTLAVGCYVGMFHHCSGLTTAPDLLAETLPVSAYSSMFDACININYIRCLATNISASSCTYKWVNSVASSGTFVKDGSMTGWTIGMNGIPTNWITQNEGLAPPTISCDGEVVTLYCNDPTITIYYRLDNVGGFVEYTQTIEITADTVVSAYAVFDGETSTTVTETCVYSPVQLVAPTITCDGENVYLACVTQGANIYYRLDGGSYTQYSASIPITADTVVDAYSTIHGRVSTVVTQTCEYSPVHHYENDYLTFKIRTNGKVYLHSNNDVVKTIDYSLNGGAWSTITASDSSTYINVSTGDVVRFRGENTSYSTSKSGYTGFGHGERTPTGQSSYDSDAAEFDIEGNIMSLVYGDNFSGQTAMTGTYNFCSLFKKSKCISAEHLILPTTTLTNYCYRAMFSWCTYLTTPPALPATTLAQGCYWYMFERCDITTAPDLLAETLVRECYGNMFTNCTNLNYIKCMAVDGLSASSAKTGWVTNVASSGTFVKNTNVTVSTWGRDNNGIPTNWLVYDEEAIATPAISFDGFDTITITCSTNGAIIWYELDGSGVLTQYTSAITISADTFIEAYSQLGSDVSQVASQNCVYISDVPIEASNRNLNSWTYNNQAVTAPYSINQLDGHSASYAKGSFNFETTFGLRQVQPTYLWFQHADQSAAVYIDNTLVEKHWGGYAAFFVDVSNYVHSGTNNVKITLKNNEGDSLAPASADFNFNATLGKVKLFTSPCLPAMNYGYDGFHITSTVSTGSATINVATSIPTGATVVCTISGTNCNYTATSASTGDEMIFTTTIANPHLWNGTIDPYLYDVKLEVYYNNELYHRYERPYGLRFYEYVINDTVKYGTAGNPYTGFLLNGQPYLLRGCCMHDDIAGKANALNDADYTQQFDIITDLGCNFLRLAHYPHPKETYDWCDRLGIIVETEAPCVNKLQSTMPEAYWTHLVGQYDDMVNQHYNHPCIVFWGLSNEAKVDDKTFAKTKIETYTSQIKAIDTERLVGLVGHALTNPSDYFGDPTNIDWIGSNLYNGWYQNATSNNPTTQLNTCISNTIARVGKAFAFSEYGCGATQRCHSETPSTTTNKGSGGARHDIEYQMWLHEGHIAAIKSRPEIVFSAQWVLFDFAVASRNEGYTVCLDGENAVIDDNLRRLNDKGLVERDHVTKKDTFYLYKAWWNPTPFVHICGKDYTKTSSRVIKCYTNESGTFTLYVNNNSVATATASNNIVEFTAQNFSSGDVVRVQGTTTNDTFTFDS